MGTSGEEEWKHGSGMNKESRERQVRMLLDERELGEEGLDEKGLGEKGLD